MQNSSNKRFCPTCTAVWPNPHKGSCYQLWDEIRGKAFSFDSPRLYATLLKILEERSMSVRALAQDLGVSNSSISRMQKGKTPDAATTIVLCTWAGLEPTKYLIVKNG